jgi:hypothetical protein
MTDNIINGHVVVPKEEVVETADTLRIVMEQDGCLIEATVPVSTLPDALYMKEYMQNTAVDMYARLRFMVNNAKYAASKEH